MHITFWNRKLLSLASLKYFNDLFSQSSGVRDVARFHDTHRQIYFEGLFLKHCPKQSARPCRDKKMGKVQVLPSQSFSTCNPVGMSVCHSRLWNVDMLNSTAYTVPRSVCSSTVWLSGGLCEGYAYHPECDWGQQSSRGGRKETQLPGCDS